MMNKIFFKLIVFAGMSAVLYSCMKETKPPKELEANFDFVSSATVLASGIHSVNDELVTKSSVKLENIIQTLSPPVEADPILKYKPVRIFTIDALSEQTVSDIFFIEGYAFVSYRNSGQGTYRGTVDVYSVENAQNIHRMARFSFDDVNINAVCHVGKHLFLACSSQDQPAFIEKIAYDPNTNADPQLIALVQVGALNLCSIAASNNTIIVLADQGTTGVYYFNAETMKQNTFVERPNPVSLMSDPETGKIFLLQTLVLVELGLTGQPERPASELNISSEGQKGLAVKDRIYVRSNNQMQILRNNCTVLQQPFSWTAGTAGAQNTLVTGKNVSVMKNWLLTLGSDGTSILFCGLRNRSEADVTEVFIVENAGQSLSLLASDDNLAFIADQNGKLQVLQRVTTGFPDIPVYEHTYLGGLSTEIGTLLSVADNNLEKYPNMVESEKTTFKTKAKTKIYASILSLEGTISNSIGYYTYNGNTPPNDVDQLNKTILFPNTRYSMEIGNTVVLSDADGMPVDIDAGKEIGFYFIQYGWDESENNGYGGVNTDNSTMYSHHALYNQNRQQQIIFKLEEQNPKFIFIGFKDKWPDEVGYDGNMRNVVIAISDNMEGKAITNIDTETIKIPVEK